MVGNKDGGTSGHRRHLQIGSSWQIAHQAPQEEAKESERA